MKIILIGSYPLNSDCMKGGVESSVYGLAQELSKKNDVVVFDMPRKNGGNMREKDGCLYVERSSNDGKTNVIGSNRQLFNIVEQIISEKPDVCHIHGTGFLSYNIYKKLRKKNIPVLLTVHGLAHIEKKKALSKRFSLKTFFQYIYQSIIEFKFLSSCGEVVVDTEYVKKEVESYKTRGKIFRLPKMIVIPQGINDVFFNVNCSRNSKMILSVGTFSPRKGHLQLIQAFDAVAKHLPEVELTIVGSLSSNDYYEKMKKKVEESPNNSRIKIIPNIDRDSLINLYSEAHVFALHSEEESQGIVFAEAMAAGLPVVATNVGGIPDVVKNGESGVLTDFNDIISFAQAMLMLMSNNDLWKSMSRNGKNLSSEYNWETIARNIEKTYKELIS